MASKNSPGRFDCYLHADPDEPVFVLLGRDPDAPALVDAWADVRERAGEDAAKVAEARTCAASMRAWLTKIGKVER